MPSEKWKSLLELLRSGDTVDVHSQACPLCGALQLSIAYTPGEKPSLGVTCLKCLAGAQIDGLAAEPPWVSRFGNKIVAGKG